MRHCMATKRCNIPGQWNCWGQTAFPAWTLLKPAELRLFLSRKHQFSSKEKGLIYNPHDIYSSSNFSKTSRWGLTWPVNAAIFRENKVPGHNPLSFLDIIETCSTTFVPIRETRFLFEKIEIDIQPLWNILLLRYRQNRKDDVSPGHQTLQYSRTMKFLRINGFSC